MLDRNKRAKSTLRQALENLTIDQAQGSNEDTREYQAKVRQRLRDQKIDRERQLEHNVAYMATMLPSAMDMHRFIKQMRKD